MVWPQRTPTTSEPNRSGLASLPETTTRVRMWCQNFQYFKPFRFGLFVLVQGNMGLCEQIPDAGLMMKSLQVAAVFLDTGYRDIGYKDSHGFKKASRPPSWAILNPTSTQEGYLCHLASDSGHKAPVLYSGPQFVSTSLAKLVHRSWICSERIIGKWPARLWR